MTAGRERHSYARVCVEIKVGAARPEMILLKDVNGSRLMQKVVYEWVPVAGKNYNVFRDIEPKCPKKPKIIQ